MGEKLLTTEEREAQGKLMINAVKKLLGVNRIGLVKKASITVEINEPIKVELTTRL